MALHNDILKNTEGYSSAMYSSWLYYRPARLMFDAGEGVSLTMRNFIFGVETVLLSHGHYDHIGGLTGMIYTRASARGDKEKPLTVYYPDGWDSIRAFRQYAETAAGHIRYDLNWIVAEPGRDIILGDNSRVKVIPAKHTSYAPCLGYALCETRKRLRREFASLPKEELAALARANGGLNEEYEKILLAYSGDSSPLNPDLVRDAEVLVHEATFVGAEDREKDGHSSVAEAIEVAVNANVGALVLFHVSGRYTSGQVVEEAVKEAKRLSYNRPLAVLYRGNMIDIPTSG